MELITFKKFAEINFEKVSLDGTHILEGIFEWFQFLMKPWAW